jgi:hypothetical protein
MQNPEIQNNPNLWWKTEDYPPAVQQHRVIVMASLIERETRTAEERPQVASVLVNRLRKGMPLQVDATVRYAMNEWSRPLTLDDLKYVSPYNTYIHEGLPPAAICNPGRESLRAALMPAETNYLYYITNDQGVTTFTEKHDDHVNLKNRIKRDRRANGQMNAPVEAERPLPAGTDVPSASPVESGTAAVETEAAGRIDSGTAAANEEPAPAADTVEAGTPTEAPPVIESAT